MEVGVERESAGLLFFWRFLVLFFSQKRCHSLPTERAN
jgi:hypothetical protein